MIRTPVRALALAGALVALAACDATGPSAEDQAITLAVAQASGQVVAGEVATNPSLAEAGRGTIPFASVDLLGGFFPMGVSATPPSGPRLPIGCAAIGAVGTRKFNCGRQQRRGSPFGDRNFNRTVTYFDAQGKTQEGYDSVTTARIVYEVSDTGAVTRSRGGSSLSDSSGRSSVSELSGILGTPDTVRIWNGSSSGYQKSLRTSTLGTQSSDMVFNDSTRAVKYRLPRTATNRFPVSGTVIRNVTVTRVKTPKDSAAVTTTRTRRVVIEFNGTNIAKMTVNGTEYELDLATGEVTPKS